MLWFHVGKRYLMLKFVMISNEAISFSDIVFTFAEVVGSLDLTASQQPLIETCSNNAVKSST